MYFYLLKGLNLRRFVTLGGVATASALLQGGIGAPLAIASSLKKEQTAFMIRQASSTPVPPSQKQPATSHQTPPLPVRDLAMTPPLAHGISCGRCQGTGSSAQVLLKTEISPENSEEALAALAPQVIAFASFGLPDATLQQLSRAAPFQGVRLVFQGLVDNSFEKTRQKMETLQINGEIDPPLFEQFDIKRVPTFVRCRLSAQGPITEGHDQLRGNIPLEQAMEIFKTRGDLP